MVKGRPEEAAEREGERHRGGLCSIVHLSLTLYFYFLLLSFFKSLLPREVRDRSALLHEVDVSRRRERNLIQVENAGDTLSHMRIWPTLAWVAAEIRYLLLTGSVCHVFSQFMPVTDRRGRL